MESNNEAVPQQQTLNLTQEQLDAVITDRLNRQKAQHAADMEALRAEARQRVAQASGQPSGQPSSVSALLEADRAKQTADDLERAGLSRYFGRTSDARAASELMKRSPQEYANAKARAAALGLLDVRQATGAPGQRIFNPVQT
jgi:hypothetical protein